MGKKTKIVLAVLLASALGLVIAWVSSPFLRIQSHLVVLMYGPRSLRYQSIKELAKHGDPAAEALVSIVLDDRQAIKLRRKALSRLERIGSEKAHALIIDLDEPLKDLEGLDSTTVRAEVLQALGRIGPAGVPTLIQALKDDEWWVRSDAAKVLSQMAVTPVSAVSALAVALGDENERVRAWSSVALAKMGPAGHASLQALTQALTQAINDQDVVVRRNAAIRLGNIGPAAESAIPALIEALKDEDRYVRREAQKALDKIRNTFK